VAGDGTGGQVDDDAGDRLIELGVAVEVVEEVEVVAAVDRVVPGAPAQEVTARQPVERVVAVQPEQEVELLGVVAPVDHVVEAGADDLVGVHDRVGPLAGAPPDA
jgi:hypothetical protein